MYIYLLNVEYDHQKTIDKRTIRWKRREQHIVVCFASICVYKFVYLITTSCKLCRYISLVMIVLNNNISTLIDDIDERKLFQMQLPIHESKSKLSLWKIFCDSDDVLRYLRIFKTRILLETFGYFIEQKFLFLTSLRRTKMWRNIMFFFSTVSSDKNLFL
jgi:hypothetical protein